jgi:hypothetical protein
VYASQPASLLATQHSVPAWSLAFGRAGLVPAEARIEVSVQLMFILLDQACPGARPRSGSMDLVVGVFHPFWATPADRMRQTFFFFCLTLLTATFA